MANSVKTPDIIAKAALPEFMNSLNMTPFIDRQHSKEFSNKVGDTITIRRITRFVAADGADVTSSIQDIVEGSRSLTLSFRKNVAVEISTQEMTLDIKDLTMQVLKPAMEELAQTVESEVAGLYKQVWNQVGTPGTTPATIADAMLPRTRLNQSGVPSRNRAAFYEPVAAGAMAAVLATVFPTDIAALAIKEGRITTYTGFAYMENQSIKVHTVGTYAGTPLVDGAAQDVAYTAVKDTNLQNLVTDGWSSTSLVEGDRFTIADVYAVNPKTRDALPHLQQFVVRADVSDTAGAATISISPPIITSGAFQTVDAAPADNAAITMLGTTGQKVPQNLALHKDAFTIAFANLDMPQDSNKAARATQDSISIRVVFDYDGKTDVDLIRFDILFGMKAQEPGYATVHAG